MKYRKRKGASLIFVITICFFLVIVSTAILYMVLGNFRARTAESKRIENLYGSESGLNTADIICRKNMEAAIKYGYTQVGEMMNLQYNKGVNSRYGGRYKEPYLKILEDIELNQNYIKQGEKEINHINTSENNQTEEARKRKLKIQSVIKNAQEGINEDKKALDAFNKEEFKDSYKAFLFVSPLETDSKGNSIYGKREDCNLEENAATAFKYTNVLRNCIKNSKYINIELTDKAQDDQVGVNPFYTQYIINLNFSEAGLGKTVYDTTIDTKGFEKNFPISNATAGSEFDKLNMSDYKSKPAVAAVNIELLNKTSEKNWKKIGGIRDVNDAAGTSESLHPVSSEVVIPETSGEYLNVVLRSKYQTEKYAAKVGKGLRELQNSLKIKIPEYADIFWDSAENTIKDIPILAVIDYLERGLTVGGDMNIENSQLNLQGSVFVEGTENKNLDFNKHDDKVYGKFNGGVKIDSSKVDIEPAQNTGRITPRNPDFITRKTLNLLDSSLLEGKGGSSSSIYAGNIYVGKDKHTAHNAKMDVENVIINNDFTLNATDNMTSINMNNFYGINERGLNYSDQNKDAEFKGNNSSSIIINSPDTQSVINIKNEAFIAGAAHIATDGNYQTGESAAVKGNYRAYSVPVNPDEKFKYDRPLQLLDTDNVLEKAKHFSDYWNGNPSGGIKLDPKNEDNKLSGGGLKLPGNTHTVGAVAYMNGDEAKAEFNPDSGLIFKNSESYNRGIRQKQGDYAKNVFDLGIANYNNSELFYEDCMNNPSRMDSVDKILINLSYELLDKYNYAGNTKNDEKNSITSGSFGVYLNENPQDTLKLKNVSSSGVIITRGNVELENADFDGVIISDGNLKVGRKSASKGNCRISYDKYMLEEAIDKYPDLFKALLKGVTFIETELPEETEDKTEEIGNIQDTFIQVIKSEYNVSKFIENGLWKVIR